MADGKFVFVAWCDVFTFEQMINDFLWHIFFSIIGAAGFFGWLMLKNKKRQSALAGFIIFLFLSLFFILPGFDGFGARQQWFEILGNWQSIFSSGAATLSALLYLASRFKPEWQKEIVQSFVVIFKIIWVGLALFVISKIGLIFSGAVPFSTYAVLPAFLFSQIAVVIITLNGVYIGKGIGPGLAGLLKSTTPQPPDKGLATRISISGSISLASWYTLLAAEKGLLNRLSLSQSLLLYGFIVVLLIVGNYSLERWYRRNLIVGEETLG